MDILSYKNQNSREIQNAKKGSKYLGGDGGWNIVYRILVLRSHHCINEWQHNIHTYMQAQNHLINRNLLWKIFQL